MTSTPASSGSAPRLAGASSAPAAAAKKRAVPFVSPQITSYFIAGGVAGAASRTVVSPLERLKIIQ